MPDGSIPQGDEFQVNTETDHSQIGSKIAALADGGFIITWTSGNQDGSSYGIYAQRYNGAGDRVGAEFQVNTETADVQQGSSVVDLDDGGFVIVWQSDAQDGSGTGIYAQRYDALGDQVGSEFRVNTETTNSQFGASIASLQDGRFIVTWTSDGQDGDAYGVYAQRYDAFGAVVGTEFLVNTFTTSFQLNATAVSLPDGGFVVTWRSTLQDGTVSSIYAQRYDVNGAAVGDEFRVNTEATSEQLSPHTTALSDGGYMVTWRAFSLDSSSYDIFGQRYDAAGDMVGIEFQVNTTSEGNQAGPAVANLPDGGFIIAWSSNGQDGSVTGVYAQRFDADGAMIGEEFLVNTETNSSQGGPSVVALSDGSFVVAWTSLHQDGDAFGVFAQQFAAQLFGTANDDELLDTVGANFIDGQAGDDALYGLDGDDLIFGNDGNDQLYGGDGNDTLKGNQGADFLDGGVGEDDLSGGSEDDELYGFDGQDTLRGGKGADVLFGENGKDVLEGGKGADLLDGGLGRDSLKGGKGDDILNGGAGKDKLYGGKGEDVFVFAADNGADKIFDFKNGKDKLDLTAFDFANKAEAKSHFFEKGSGSNDVVGFKFDGTTIRIEGLDLGDINNADIII